MRHTDAKLKDGRTVYFIDRKEFRENHMSICILKPKSNSVTQDEVFYIPSIKAYCIRQPLDQDERLEMIVLYNEYIKEHCDYRLHFYMITNKHFPEELIGACCKVTNPFINMPYEDIHDALKMGYKSVMDNDFIKIFGFYPENITIFHRYVSQCKRKGIGLTEIRRMLENM